MRATILLLLSLFALSVRANLTANIDQYGAALCGNNTGYAIAWASGGVPPYTYLWSNGATTDTITGLAPGNYTVTVTDANTDQDVAFVSIWNDLNPVLTYAGPGAGLHGCHGQCNIGMWYWEGGMPMNLVPPFTFSNELVCGLNPNDPLQGAWTGMCPGQTFITSVTDALGCVAQLQDNNFLIGGSDPGPMSVVSTQPSCEGMNGGSALLNVGLEINNAYTTLWNATLLDENMQVVPGVNFSATPVPGSNIASIGARPPGNYFIERRFFHYQGECVDLLPVTIPSLGPDCGIVNGSAFLDYNENCLLNGGEPPVPSGIIEVLPGPYYTRLAANGNYLLSLPSGNYTLTQQSPSVEEHCTGGPIPFTVIAGAYVQRLLPDTSVVPLDLEVSMTSGPARPGFQFQCGAIVRNLTPTSSGAITLSITFDPLLTYVGASPTPSSVVGNTLTWNQGALLGWQWRGYLLQFSVPADPGLIGTVLQTTATVSSVGTDADLSNNTGTNNRTITGSYDPNDKLARTSTGASDELYYIDQDEWIDYVIRFQNTGTDTAFNILITDTLASTLDPATLHIGAASHPFTWELRDQGTLKFYFQNILLPDSNYSEPLSHGFVSFRIKPRLPLLPGTVIENTANIFFDFNEPVITEPSVLVAEFSTGVPDAFNGGDVDVFPNPTNGSVTVRSLSGDMRSLALLAMDGRTVLAERLSGISMTEIDLASIASGTYVVVITTGTGEQLRTRLIKL